MTRETVAGGRVGKRCMHAGLCCRAAAGSRGCGGYKQPEPPPSLSIILMHLCGLLIWTHQTVM